MTLSLHLLLYFYGTFLIICGVVAVAFIGVKAKTALMSGGMSGAVNIVIGYLVSTGASFAPWLGIAVSLALFIVFSWRSTKTLFKIFELIPSNHPDLNGKGIAFLIISLMAVVSVVVLMLQVVNALYPYSA
jgi:uncharacterized membrane protein (UPF0136 family)